MKPTSLLLVFLVAGLIAGCHSTGSSTADGASKSRAASKTAPPTNLAGLDTTKLVEAFRTADTDTVQLVQNTVSAIRGRDWSGALSTLEKIRRIPGLTAAQADAVNSLLTGLGAKTS